MTDERRQAERRTGELPYTRLMTVRDTADRRVNPPAPLRPCPQCGSLYCGPVACRFSGTKHDKVIR